MSEQAEQLFGGVPAWLLADYLIDLGGLRSHDSTVAGDGWRATLAASARPPGAHSVGRVTVTIEGPEAERIMEELRRKAQRGGG